MSSSTARRLDRHGWLLALLLPLLIFGGILLWWTQRPGLTEDEVREAVITTIQSEAAESFYITGYLDLTASTTLSSTRYLLPRSLRLNLGSTRATVRLPGRVSYGIDVERLRPELIEFGSDSVVTVTLPELEIYSVEPVLSQMEVRTESGWTRLFSPDAEPIERQAMLSVENALRRQGTSHIRDAAQPRINTARALERLLTPILEAAGLPDPRFRFLIGEGIVIEDER